MAGGTSFISWNPWTPPAAAPPSIYVLPASAPAPLVTPPQGSGALATDQTVLRSLTRTRENKVLSPDLGSPLLAAQLAARNAGCPPQLPGLAARLLGAYIGHRIGLGIPGVVAGWLLAGVIVDARPCAMAARTTSAAERGADKVRAKR